MLHSFCKLSFFLFIDVEEAGVEDMCIVGRSDGGGWMLLSQIDKSTAFQNLSEAGTYDI